jgi:DNA repair protein RAD7
VTYQTSWLDLVADSYVTLAALCPNLEQLSLELCGRLDTDTMIKWGQVFPHLKRLELWGPFNVRKEGWIQFFKDKGEQLEGLLIT